MRSPIDRFTSRVENYVRYRPSYPAAVLDLLTERCGLGATSQVADVGSGTGILTQMLLQTGAAVWGVEPNERMRLAAERMLGCQARFHSVAGSAEASTLKSASVDLITVGQAFHWFDVLQTRVEFARILKPGGCVALIWNERPRQPTPFVAEYEAVLRKHSHEYEDVTRRRQHAESAQGMQALFASGYERIVFPNLQSLDAEGLVGRALSSSYTPEPGDPRHEPMLAELHEVFARHARGGDVVFTYETEVYLGGLQP